MSERKRVQNLELAVAPAFAEQGHRLDPSPRGAGTRIWRSQRNAFTTGFGSASALVRVICGRNSFST